MKSSPPKVSIIVPVYNVERYLRRCMDSLIAQTLKDIEIICVDDGSSDGSFPILREYAERDLRIKNLRQANGGVSKARNAGLDVAQAPYVMFCDPDDWVEPTWCQELYEAIDGSGADFAVSRAFIDGECSPEQREVLERNQRLKYLGLQDVVPEMYTRIDHGLWIHIFRRSQLDAWHIRFPVGSKVGEDWLFRQSVLVKSRKAYFLDRMLYHYVQRTGSALNGDNSDFQIDVSFLENVMRLYEFLTINECMTLWGEKYFSCFATCVAIDVFRTKSRKEEFYAMTDRFLANVRESDLVSLTEETRRFLQMVRDHTAHWVRTDRYGIGNLTIAKRKCTPFGVRLYILGIRVYRRRFP